MLLAHLLCHMPKLTDCKHDVPYVVANRWHCVDTAFNSATIGIIPLALSASSCRLGHTSSTDYSHVQPAVVQ